LSVEIETAGGELSVTIQATVELEDLEEMSDEQSSQLEEDIHEILDNAGAAIVDHARGLVPIRTGALYNSIYYEVDEEQLSVTAGAAASYAAFVELGTRKMAARPFLIQAALEEREEMNAEVEEAITSRLQGNLESDEPGNVVTVEIEGVTNVSQD